MTRADVDAVPEIARFVVVAFVVVEFPLMMRSLPKVASRG
jgi:hypothetical protein